MLKQLLSSTAFQEAMGRLVAAYMRLVGRFTRWEEIGREHAEPFWRERRAAIVLFWHGRLIAAPYGWPAEKLASPFYMLVSASKEGGITNKAVRTIGYGVIRGSTAKGGKDKGGAQALRDMVRALRDGGHVGVTPDGPRGPGGVVTPGIVTLARMSGAPILVYSWCTRNRLVFRSWDRMVLPLPFGRGCYVWAPPIEVPREGDPEVARLAVEAELARITALADQRCGLEPAP